MRLAERIKAAIPDLSDYYSDPCIAPRNGMIRYSVFRRYDGTFLCADMIVNSSLDLGYPLYGRGPEYWWANQRKVAEDSTVDDIRLLAGDLRRSLEEAAAGAVGGAPT